MLISSWRCGRCLTGLSGNSCAQAALNTHCILRLSPVILLAVSAHQIRLCVTLISRDWLPAGLPQVAWRWAKGSNGQVMLAECFWDWRTGGGRSCAESTGQSSKSCLLGLTEVPRAVPWKYATSLRAQLPHPLRCSVQFLSALGRWFKQWESWTISFLGGGSARPLGTGRHFRQEGPNQEWDGESCEIEKVEWVNFCFFTFGWLP